MGKILAIFQMGGQFTTDSDGSMSYSGGDAHAFDIKSDMTFDSLLSEISELFHCDASMYTFKYFLPGNRRTLITISSDKDLSRMVDFHSDSLTTDVYLLKRTDVPTSTTTPTPSPTHRRRTRSMLADSVPIDVIPINEYSEGSAKRICDSWDNSITGVGQAFASPRAFRDALKKYAIAKNFMYKFIKNEGPRISVRCAEDECPWRIYASKNSNKHELTIKKFNDTHTCEREGNREHNKLATQGWIASLIKDKLRETPDYSPRDIAKDFKKEYGLNLSYYQAWRGKSLAKKELHGSHEEASDQLPWFCEKLVETNPGSFAVFEEVEDSKLGRLFISFRASINGFEHGCRPLLFLDSVSLKSARQWKILAATGVDGENEVFPVAFAVIEDDSKENWQWFMLQLKSVLGTSRTITFVLKRQNELEEKLAEIFPGCIYGYCVNSLIEEFKSELDDSLTKELKETAVEDFASAVHACKVDEFNAIIDKLKAESEKSAERVLSSKPEYWSNAFFKGLRYGKYSSEASGTFNSWISIRNEPSIVQAVDIIRCKIMEMIYTRRENSNAWMTILTPSANDKIQEEIIKAQTLEVVHSTDNIFEVRDEGKTDIVNIDTWECTCRRWQVIGLPCVHALAVVERTDRCASDLCSKYFTMVCYRETYAMSINPIGDAVNGIVAVPVRQRRGPGGQFKKLKATESVLKAKRPVTCSKCKVKGHYSRTCKA
ncbi:uncharacterized protein A4U43_C03F30310 [Asparagus officinalis]|uniref:SWIM-type domain-containing protein n=1 Tax=Asparagus officinalis TaxID=4686 RepID=A0A5P1FGV0_ASPOF|nr:uncharacterized protein LOC109835672 [Asparagus officinalis]ONK76627.1 uncharacterized protein A4U43_C03F30310 [Asparagus officinalis]